MIHIQILDALYCENVSRAEYLINTHEPNIRELYNILSFLDPCQVMTNDNQKIIDLIYKRLFELKTKKLKEFLYRRGYHEIDTNLIRDVLLKYAEWESIEILHKQNVNKLIIFRDADFSYACRISFMACEYKFKELLMTIQVLILSKS